MDSSVKKHALFLQLDQCSDVNEFFAVSTAAFSESINELTHRSLTADLFPIPLVGTLLDNDKGPLEDSSVKLRILSNLAQIDKQDVEDILAWFTLAKINQNTANKIEYDDPQLYDAICELNIVKELKLINFFLIEQDMSLNENFYNEAVEHQKREIRQDLTLGIITLLERLDVAKTHN